MIFNIFKCNYNYPPLNCNGPTVIIRNHIIQSSPHFCCCNNFR